MLAIWRCIANDIESDVLIYAWDEKCVLYLSSLESSLHFISANVQKEALFSKLY